MYSQLIIFCSSLDGRLGIPGIGAMGEVSVGDIVVEKGTWTEVEDWTMGRRGRPPMEDDENSRSPMAAI